MNILISSNSSWSPSGYGVQISSLAKRLRDAGHTLSVSAFYGLQGGQIDLDGVHHYPAGYAPYGNDVLPLHAAHAKADIVITLIDVWVLNQDMLKAFRFVPWTPIDHSPVPGAVISRLRQAWEILSYSKFAIKELERVGLKSVYIPHGVETDVFKPMPNKTELRKKFGIPEDAFVVGMVAANQSKFPTRKGFERILPAIANLREKHKDIVLYLHTHAGMEMGGVPIVEIIKAFNMGNATYISRPDTFVMGGLPRNELAELYNCFDLYACPSTSEGFGIPLIESAACGIPSVATDFSACTELCFSGWTVKPITMFLTPLLSFQAIPDITELQERIEHAYLNPAEVQAAGELSRQRAQEYEWNKIVDECWIPALAEMDRRVAMENEHRGTMLHNASMRGADRPRPEIGVVDVNSTEE